MNKAVKLNSTLNNYSEENTQLSYLHNQIYNITLTTALKYYYRRKSSYEVLISTEQLFLKQSHKQPPSAIS